jgi:hypothetical protein
VDRAQQLLQELERDFSDPPQAASAQYRIELVSIVSSDGAGESDDNDEFLRQITPALVKRGMKNPEIIGVIEIIARPGKRFSTSDSTQRIQGTLVDSEDGLEIDVEFRGISGPVAFSTSVAMRLDHPIVFAASRTNKHHVFALRILSSDDK